MTPAAARASLGRRVVLALALALGTSAAACSRSSSRAAPANHPAPPGAGAQTFHGGPAAHPGDWCGGHGVPESECTRCNPHLVPQFQARGDWCAEHGVPESQCTLCHPELRQQGVVPPSAPPPRGADGGHAARGGDGAGAARGAAAAPFDPHTVVRLASAAVAERVGIETAPAEARPLRDELVAPLRIEFDPSRLARVSARVPGVVQSLAVDLGARVRRGQHLFTLDSAIAAGARAEAGAARARLVAAQAALRRLEGLGPGLATAAQLEQARAELAAARAALTAHVATAAVVGGGGGRVVRVASPRDGVVVARRAAVGQQVTAEEVVVEVADVAAMWGILDVPEADAARLRVGLAVTVEVPGLAATRGAIAWLSPAVDAHTRTVAARVELPNADERLRANAFGRARVELGDAEPSAGVVVPRDALHAVEGRDVVFVQRSAVLYEPRLVDVALRGAREVRLRGGVAPGERVVTVGGFQLKTEIQRDGIGAGCCGEAS